MSANKRAGAMLLEATLAVTLLAAAMVAVAQLAALAAQQRKETRWRQTAIREAGNVLERISRLPADQVTASGLQAIRLSSSAEMELPAGQLQAVLTPDQELEPARRITVRVSWEDSSGLRVRPLELVGWRFDLEEPSP